MAIFQRALKLCSGHFRLKILAASCFSHFFGQDNRTPGACFDWSRAAGRVLHYYRNNLVKPARSDRAYIYFARTARALTGRYIRALCLIDFEAFCPCPNFQPRARVLLVICLMLRPKYILYYAPLGRFAFGKTPRGPRCARQARQRLATCHQPWFDKQQPNFDGRRYARPCHALLEELSRCDGRLEAYKSYYEVRDFSRCSRGCFAQLVNSATLSPLV